MGIEILLAIDRGAKDFETIRLFSGVTLSCIKGRIPVLLDLNLIEKHNNEFCLKEKGLKLKMELLNKPIEFYATAGVANIELYFAIIPHAFKALQKKPVDMLVIEEKDGLTHFRSAGYDLQTQSKLDETTIISKVSIKDLITEKVWLKIDDYGDKFVATLLYPSEY